MEMLLPKEVAKKKYFLSGNTCYKKEEFKETIPQEYLEHLLIGAIGELNGVFFNLFPSFGLKPYHHCPPGKVKTALFTISGEPTAATHQI